jgi:hypothetical protein
MKRVITIITLLFFIQQSKAECIMGGITYFPEQQCISQNSIFIFEGYAFDQDVINSFNENRQAYLETDDGDKVVLKIEDIFIGQMGLTQAMFRPEEKLKLDKKYYLKFTNLTDDEKFDYLTKFNQTTGKREPIYWEVTDDQTVELNSELNLNFDQTEVEYYGCGPSAFALFQTQHSLGMEIWYRTEVYDKSAKTSTTYIIKDWDEKLRVGHDMCAGGFTFTKKGNYKVRFTPMNIDGIELPTTEWTSFESPFKNSDNPWGY